MATAPGQQFADWTNIQGGGGLGMVGGLYLADKLGLIDLSNKEHADNVKKYGVLGSVAANKLGVGVPPKQLAPVSDAIAKPVGEIQGAAPIQGAVPPASVEVGGPMNQQLPQGQPIPPMGADVNVGGPMDLSLPQGQPLPQMDRIGPYPRQYDDSFNDFDSDIGNFASLFMKTMG